MHYSLNYPSTGHLAGIDTFQVTDDSSTVYMCYQNMAAKYAHHEFVEISIYCYKICNVMIIY